MAVGAYAVQLIFRLEKYVIDQTQKFCLIYTYVDFEVRIIFQGIPYAPLPAAAEAAGIKKIHVG